MTEGKEEGAEGRALRHLQNQLQKFVQITAGEKYDHHMYGLICSASVKDTVYAPNAAHFNRLNKTELCKLFEEACGVIYPAICDVYGYGLWDDRDVEEEFHRRYGREVEAACKERDDMMRKTIALQDKVVDLQEQLLKLQSQQLTQVSETVNRDLRSFSAVVSHNCKTALAPAKLQIVMSRAAKAESGGDTDRTKNLMVFGLSESGREDEVELKGKVEELMGQLDEKPQMSVKRIGLIAKGKARPVVVTLRSRAMLLTLLKKAKQLRETEKFSRVYLSRDLTPGERAERRSLYKTVADLQRDNPGRTFRIKDSTIQIVPSG